MQKILLIFLTLFLAYLPNNGLAQKKNSSETTVAQTTKKKKKPKRTKKTKKTRKKKSTKKPKKSSKKATKKSTKKPEKIAAKEETDDKLKEKEKEQEEKEEEEEEEEEEFVPEKEFKANFLVEILPDKPIRRWVAKAIEYKIYQDLSEFNKLEPSTKETVKPKPCKEPEEIEKGKEDKKTDKDKKEKKANKGKKDKKGKKEEVLEECDTDTVIVASIYFNGLLKENSLSYEIQDLNTLQILETGSIPFNKSIGLPELRVEIFRAMKPITGKSGLIDRLEAKAKINLAREERDKKIQEIVQKETEEELKEAAEEELKEQGKDLAKKGAKEKDQDQDQDKLTKKDKDKDKDKDKLAKKGKDQDQDQDKHKDKDKIAAEGEEGEKKEGEEKGDEEDLANVPPPEPDWWQIAVDHVQVFAEKNRDTLKLILMYFFAIITFGPMVLFSIYQTVSRGSSQFNRSILPLLLITALITLTMIFIQGGQLLSAAELQKLNESWEKLPDLKWLGPIFGGFLFGYLLIICLKTAIPLIHGFEELEHRMISLVLRSWAWLTFVRLVLMTPIVLGFLFFIFLSAIVYEVDRYLFFSLLLPLGGLYAWFWTAYMMENFAVNLDKTCVYGPATKKNPWNKCIREYLSQYFKRAGLEADPKFLDDIIFLPHKEDDVDTYGGGLSKARVVVSRKILSFALNIPEEAPPKVDDKETVPVEFGDEIEKPEEIVGKAEIPPPPPPRDIQGADDDLDEESTAGDDLEHSASKKIRTEFMKLEDFQKITSFKKYEVELDLNAEGDTEGGGFAVKDDSQEAKPDAETKKDKKLKTTTKAQTIEKTRTEVIREDQLYRVKKEADANFTIDIQSSSSDYHDFLFGLLLSEIGHVLKRGSGMNTLVLMMAKVNTKLPQFLSKGLERVFAAYHKNFARFSLILSDSIAQIYRGEPHLLQYLYFIESGKEGILSKNADTKGLAHTSQVILESIEAWIPELSKKTSNISLLQKRLLWLKGYFYSFTKEEKRYNRATRLFKVLAPAFLVVFISYKIVDSALYNSVYHERIEAQKKALEEKEKEKEAKEKEKNSLNLPIKEAAP